MEVAFAKKAGKALIVASLMKRPGNACLIVQVKESLIWNPKLVNVIKASLAMIALPGFAVWIVETMEGKLENNLDENSKLFIFSYSCQINPITGKGF